MFLVFVCAVHLTVSFYDVTYAFQRESTLYTCLNVKELPARSWRGIGSLSDWNLIGTQKHLVRKGTLQHLAEYSTIQPFNHLALTFRQL